MEMLNILNVTSIYAACLGILLFALSLNVIRLRWKHKVGIGEGKDNKDLRTGIRMHANFTEYVPTILLLLALAEISGSSDLVLHIIGACLLLGRILHPIGLFLSIGTSAPRALGMALTFTSLLVSSINLLIHSL